MTALFVVAAGIVVFDGWLYTCGFQGCPSGAQIRAFHPSEGGSVVDRDGRLIGHLAVVRRVNVPLAEVPKQVQDAFIATEDRRFYEHNGLDWRGFFRAAVRDIAAMGPRQGFSTITMQVARNIYLENRFAGRSLRRKLIELRLTRLLERDLSKDQILEHYLNIIYLGSGVDGVEAASRDLFGKSVSRLDLAESAMLAALPKGPSAYTPRSHPQAALRRRNLVLSLMAEQGYITPAQESAAQDEPLRIASREWRPAAIDEPSALDAVRAIVDSVLPDALKEGDVTVNTTLDLRLQRAADRVIARQAVAITRETRASYGRVPAVAQGAYVAMDPSSGDILAVVPGRRTDERGGFDRAFDARRQPGSAFKPFVYETALAAGLSPATMVDDDPVEVVMGNQVWRPADYNNEYEGRVTLRRALTVSANAATVRVSRTVGERNIVAVAHRNGIRSDLPPVPSVALGAVEVTPVELVTAYAPFDNGGYRVSPRLVTSIVAPDGTVLWAADSSRVPVMDPRDSYEITSMLRSVVDYGTGRPVRDMGLTGPIAGKTGTTNNGADVWFVGYTPTLLAGVWFGYDEPRPIAPNATGGRLAAPAWAEIYQAGWREPRGSDWVVPDNMVPVVIDPETGMLATEYCPTRETEYFKPGSEPTEPCNVHTAPSQPMTDAGAIGNALPPAVQQIGKGIGGLLRRIFRF